LQALRLFGQLPHLHRDDRVASIDIVRKIGGYPAHQPLSLICRAFGNRYAVLAGGDDQDGRRQSRFAWPRTARPLTN
jgi:hypothetical protein